MNDWKTQFKEWLNEIIPGDGMETYVQFVGRHPDEWNLEGNKVNVDVEPDSGESIRVRIFTKNERYTIVATQKYLGCTASNRKPRAGEDWTRGSDLPDGEFSRKTWERIKNRIVAYELVRVAKPREEVADRMIEEPAKET
jgi:hypothetical protein